MGALQALGWAPALMRGPKLHAAAVAVTGAEIYIVDEGPSGNNGKGFMWALVQNVFGSYSELAKDTMLQQPPPRPGSPFPEALAMRGVRILGTPEIEPGNELKAGWLKLLGDSSTTWKARGLFTRTELTFKIPAVLCVSTNTRLNLSSVDGGIRRRQVAFNWPVFFVNNPEGIYQRQRVEGVKLEKFFTPLLKVRNLLQPRSRIERETKSQPCREREELQPQRERETEELQPTATFCNPTATQLQP